MMPAPAAVVARPAPAAVVARPATPVAAPGTAIPAECKRLVASKYRRKSNE
jgi:hypothetical protein